MSDTAAILDQLNKTDRRLSRIEEALSQLAVQNARLHRLEKDVCHVTKNWNDFAKPDGTLSKIMLFQAKCPGPEIKSQITRLWVAVIPISITFLVFCLAMIKVVFFPEEPTGAAKHAILTGEYLWEIYQIILTDRNSLAGAVVDSIRWTTNL